MKVRSVSVHGRKRWRADCGVIDGKRKQLTFKKKEDAENFLETSKGIKKSGGNKALITYLAITENEREDIVRARQIRQGAEIKETWEEIMAFYAKNKPRTAKVRIGEAVEAFLKAKREQRTPTVSENYVKELKYVLEAFIEEYPIRQAHEFNETLIKEYLSEYDNGYTYNNHLTALSMLFKFSVQSGWCVESPCAKLKKIKGGEEVPETYTNEEVQKLLDTAANDPELRPILPAYAISIFAFLRIAEVKRLIREEIKLRSVHPIITVMPNKAKTKSLRNVAISLNLRIILETCGLPDGKLAPSDFDWRREQLHKKAGVPWKRNGGRHTGASNHCVRPFQLAYPAEDHGLTSAMLGHRNPEMLFKHYLALRDPLDGIPFWKIVPEGFPVVALEEPVYKAA